MNAELSALPAAYPRNMSCQRINDAIILTLDLPDSLMPSVGQPGKHGFTVKDISELLDIRLYEGDGGEGRFATDLRARIQVEIEDLIKFVGLVARLHEFVNRQEHASCFPGCKTIYATGLRRPFKRSDGSEDPLAANFSFSNACAADDSLHGAALFIDDNIARLVSTNPFALNLFHYACLISREKHFDPAEEYRGELYVDTEWALSAPQNVNLFRKSFIFREMRGGPLTYLQLIHLLSDYLTGVKQPAKECPDLISSSLDPIRTGPDVADLRSGRAPKGRFFLNDISTDIRILPEFIASGSSPTAQLELRTSVVTVPRAC